MRVFHESAVPFLPDTWRGGFIQPPLGKHMNVNKKLHAMDYTYLIEGTFPCRAFSTRLAGMGGNAS